MHSFCVSFSFMCLWVCTQLLQPQCCIAWATERESQTYDPPHNSNNRVFPTRLGRLYCCYYEFNIISGELPCHTISPKPLRTTLAMIVIKSDNRKAQAGMLYLGSSKGSGKPLFQETRCWLILYCVIRRILCPNNFVIKIHADDQEIFMSRFCIFFHCLQQFEFITAI